MYRVLIRPTIFAVLAGAIVLCGPSRLTAQTVTTGTITGVVNDQQGGVLPGSSVTAVHQPTGTTYDATTGPEGRFAIFSVRVGGPYRVTASLSGFREQESGDVFVRLGENLDLVFHLPLEALTEVVTITAQSSTIEPTQAGTAENVGTEAIEELPTIARSLTDFARLSPHFNATSTNSGATFLSVAGRNNRYNNLQIDGAVNNDLFGLADSGSPGGQTETQPISLDAIQELQLVVAPYDVRQGGFSGGGVNAITRGGTNQFRGTAYYFGRSQDWIGDGPQDRDFGTFNDWQGGASLGGPIAENTAFFFGNVELARREVPSGFSVSGSGQPFGRVEEVTRFREILVNQYGYDPGGLDEFIRNTDSDKVFVRSDINLSSAHRLTIRHNYVDGASDVGFPTNTLYLMPDNFYQITSETNSTVGQLNSTFGSLFNELRITYQRIRDNRTGESRFPFVLVRLPDGSRLRAGTENFSTANRLDQDVVEITNDLTMVKGSHTFTFGTHNELFRFDNLFIRDNFGNYEFASLDDLAAGFAQGFDHSFSATADPLQSSEFKVNQFGFYAGDQWRVGPNFTLAYGVRVDVPFFPDKPTRNPVSEDNFGFRTDVAPDPAMWSPRAGFNWDLVGDGRQQIRGGAGLFTGRTPYVWLSNQYGNTGIEFTRLRVFFAPGNQVPFITDPDAQPKSIGAAATNEIDLVDPGYDFPQVLRGNLAYDRDLGVLGLFATAELLFTRTIKDIAYQNLNIVQTGTRPDGRPVFGRLVPTLSDVILLTNTDEGDIWSVAFKVDRPFRDGFYASASYLYGEAENINDGTSSQAASNWGNLYVPGDPNNAPLATSNFEVGHRVNLSASYQFNLGRGFSTTASMYYNGQSGRPYSTTFSNDVNGDGRALNDLVFVPATADDVVVIGGTFADLDAYISGDDSMRDFRGQIVPRNTGRSPWTNNVDVRFAVGVPVRGRTEVELTLDFLNFWNLFDKNSGTVEFANFNQVQAIRFAGVDAATGRMIYDIAAITRPGFTPFILDDLRSRWQAQFGARVRF